MARLNSSVYSIIRGSIGDITYTSDRHHQIVAKGKPIPFQPNTAEQMAMRAALTASSAAWKALTEAQRAAWHTYAQTISYDKPVTVYRCTGRNVFLGSNTFARWIKALYNSALTVSNIAPVDRGRPLAPRVTVSGPGGPNTGIGFTIFNNTPVPLQVMIQVSAGKHASHYYYRGPYPTGKCWPLAVNGSLKQVFTGYSAGQRIHWRMRFITGSTAGIPHRISVPVYENRIVITGA